jgi:hypothetical protein
MNLVNAKVYVVSVFRIIFPVDNYLPVVSRKMPSTPIIALSNFLPCWFPKGKYKVCV